MGISVSDVKNTAKQSLKGGWIQAVVVCLIFMCVYIIEIFFKKLLMTVFKGDYVWFPFKYTDIVYTDSLANIIITFIMIGFSFFITLPLFLGVFKWFSKMAEKEKQSVLNMFYFFSSFTRYKNAVKLWLGLFVRFALFSFLSMIPFIAISILMNPMLYRIFGISMPEILSYFWSINLAVFIIGGVLTFLLMMRYFPVFTLVCNNDNILINQAIKNSKKISKGYRSVVIYFILSFVGWGVLCWLIIPVLFVLPYFMVSFAIICNNIIKKT